MKEQEGRSLERISWDLGKQFRQTEDDRQRELFEDVAVRAAVIGYLLRKKKQNEYDDELLAMLSAMDEKEAATGAAPKSLPENGE